MFQVFIVTTQNTSPSLCVSHTFHLHLQPPFSLANHIPGASPLPYAPMTQTSTRTRSCSPSNTYPFMPAYRVPCQEDRKAQRRGAGKEEKMRRRERACVGIERESGCACEFACVCVFVCVVCFDVCVYCSHTHSLSFSLLCLSSLSVCV